MEREGPELERIGAYRIERRLGSGGMGEVFLAYDERLHRRVAIKRIRRDVEATPERRRRFRREARAAAGLSHPAIVQIHDILEDATGDAIVMEFVEGCSLAERLAAGSVDGSAAVSIARQVAEGLAKAHEHGLVHRDLKAENVMLDHEGRAKVVDFGLVKPFEVEAVEGSLTREGAVLGTMRAMSPEQAAGEEVDERSDLFSLGVLLYEMLSGRSPFGSGNALQIHRRILTEKAPPLQALRPELPVELSSLVDALLEKYPEHRPAGARRVAAQLAEIAATRDLSCCAPPLAVAGHREADSDLPTVVPPAQRGLRTTAVPATAERANTRASWRWFAAAVFFIVVGSATYLLHRDPIRVAVLPAQLEASVDDERAAFVAFAIEEAVIDTLVSLRGLEVLDPEQLRGGHLSRVETARQAAADEILRTTIRCRPGGFCGVAFRRVRVRLEEVVATVPAFDVSTRPADSLELATAVQARLLDAYPDRRGKRGAELPEVSPEDHTAFLRLRRRHVDGEVLDDQRLAELAAILESSPRFPEAHLLAAHLAQARRDFESSIRHAEQAARLAPGDPRPLQERLESEILSGHLEQAQRTLDQLERLAPGDLRAWKSRARLAVRRGELREALALWQRVYERVPSWQNLWEIADLEKRLGLAEEARQHFLEILEREPRNAWALERLGQLETLYGNLRTAESLFQDVTNLRTLPDDFNNLGWVRLLLGRYSQAAASFRRALELAPDLYEARLSLADAELARGRQEQALQLYRQLAEELQSAQPTSVMLRAVSLARLGDWRTALELTDGALEGDSQDPQTLFQAALVYTLIGQRADARLQAEKALQSGLNPRWFRAPGFEPLRRDPELTALGDGSDVRQSGD